MKTKRCCCITCTTIISLIFLGIIGILIAFEAVDYPYHASCKIEWTFDKPCEDVQSAIVSQLRAWQGDNCPNQQSSCAERGLPTNCIECSGMPCGQRCLYNYTGTNDNTINAFHLTPVQRYKDDLTFTSTPKPGNQCHVEAFSTSSTWYAILDFGTNYCNLRNIVDGAGLSNEEGFNEQTSTSVCTQYDSKDCTRF